MSKDWPWIVAIALLVGVAMSIAAYAMGSGTTTVNMLAIALVSLGLAQIVGLMRNASSGGLIGKLADNQSDIVETINRLSGETRRINAESSNLARNFEQFRSDSATLNVNLAEGLASLRQSHETVAGDMKAILDGQRDIQSSLSTRATEIQLKDAIAREQMWLAQMADEAPPQPEYVAEAPPIEDSFANSGLAEALHLSLEPIVDLFTSNTAHYRMVLGMTNEQGQDVEHEVFVHHADRMGLRADLDQHVIEQTLELLSQLRQRDHNLSIFVPVGTGTLSSVGAVQNIIAMLKGQPQMANGVVLDMPHSVLATLPEASLEGLATLARAGVNLSLSQASIAGIDLAALNSLNVRWVGLAASSVGIGKQVSAGLAGFVQSARALRIQIIISHVGDPRHVEGLSRTARFASGPAFAMPRKLKRAPAENTALAQAA